MYMANNNDGEIILDLVLNQNRFKKQFSGLQGTVTKIGGKLAAAFSTAAIGALGKQCLELGSDLAEVQNVVDTAFPKMSGQVDKFAKNAASSFGLSETMAKRFSGTFGSMAKAFGFAEKKSAEMATSLTGLAGDVASFYNISQDEAYTKLKSVFTGETESLKDLGVVMTQTALDSYAMANGFGKTTKEMTEAEKVALRYAFVQNQLKDAVGDFAKTSGSWANQVRILSLQFDSLRATIGQGLINLFTPIIKQVNTLMGGLIKLAEHFKAFTELITGNKSQSGSVGATASAAADASSSLDSATDSANNLSDATTGVGKAAQQAAKKMAGLMGFDELNNVSTDSDTDSSDSGSSGSSSGVDFGSLASGENVLDKTGTSAGVLSDKLQGVLNKLKELKDAFVGGFQIGLGNTDSVFASLKSSLASIKSSFTSIVSDEGLQSAVSNWCTSMASYFGQVAGSITSIGLTIADLLLGGISKYLEQHKGDITDDLTSMFDVSSQHATILGCFYTTIADIASVFRSDAAKQITASIINIFADSALNVSLLFAKLGRDIATLISTPIVENKDKIKTALENTLKPISSIIETISATVSETWDKIQKLYDTKVKPLVDSLADGISGWMGTFLDGYNTYIAPVLDKISKRFEEVVEKKVKPAIDKVVGAFGDFCDMVKELWEMWLQPFVDWCIATIVPIFAKLFETASGTIMDAFSSISDVIDGVATTFSGVCNTIKSLSEGDWKGVWEGAKQALSGVVKSIKGYFSTLGNAIKLTFTPLVTFFKEIWSKIKEVFKPIASWFSDKFSAAYDKAKSAFSKAKSYFKGVWDDIKEPFKNISTWFKEKFSDAWSKVKDVFSTGGKIYSGIKAGIEKTFKSVVNTLIDGINKVINLPFEKINGMLNKIRNTKVLGKQPFEGLWAENPISTPQIPKLASGGYVKKNTPQLAMIGDNRHQGEVVAPEDKLQALLDSALKRSGEVTATALIPVIERLCNAVISLENGSGGIPQMVPVSDTGLYRIVEDVRIKEEKRHGRR